MRLVALSAAVVALGSADTWRAVQKLSSTNPAAEAKKVSDAKKKAREKKALEDAEAASELSANKKKIAKEQQQLDKDIRKAQERERQAGKEIAKNQQRDERAAEKKANADRRAKSFVELQALDVPFLARPGQPAGAGPSSFAETAWRSELLVPYEASEADVQQALDAETTHAPVDYEDRPDEKDWPTSLGPGTEAWLDKRLQSKEDELNQAEKTHKGFVGTHPHSIAKHRKTLGDMKDMATLVKKYDKEILRRMKYSQKLVNLEHQTHAQLDADRVSLRSEAPEDRRWHSFDQYGRPL